MVHWELHDRSITKEKFWGFLEALKKKMKKTSWVLYLDNLKVHTCEDSRAYMDRIGIEYIWAPVYSPDKNAIEFYFSALKGHVRKARLQAMVAKRDVTYPELVRDAVRDIENEKTDNFITHVLKIFGLN